ncbi:MAG: hypothetical protein EAS51_12470 [Microbacteriaceae bacterium]|nr:MAG: hypothetical protein EAS51_12470 [Microbacteriaceae bacterium]
MKRPFLIELRHSGFRYWAPIFALAGATIGWLNSFPRIAAWVSIESSMLDVAYFLTPFLAGAGAWEGLRDERRRVEYARRTSAIPAPLSVLPRYLGGIAWVVAAWICIALVLVLRSMLIGLYGVPEPILLLHSLALVLSFTTIGFALAETIQHWSAIPVATVLPLALYGATLAGRAGDVATWINIFRKYVAIDASLPNAMFFGGAALVSVGAAVVFAAASFIRRRAYRSPAILTMIVAGAVIVSGLGVMIGQQGRTSREPAPAELAFITLNDADTGLTIRVREHYAPVADELTDTWSRIADLFSESDLAFDKLEQQLDSDHQGAPQGFARLYLNPQSTEIARFSVEGALVDVMNCTQAGQDGPAGDFGLGGVVVMQAWLTGDTALGVGAWSNDPRVVDALDRLYSLDNASARAWVQAHTANIRSCEWDASDFQP